MRSQIFILRGVDENFALFCTHVAFDLDAIQRRRLTRSTVRATVSFVTDRPSESRTSLKGGYTVVFVL